MYDSKIATARKLIEDHNSAVDDSSKIDFDSFLKKLHEAGGTSDDALKAASWEDLRDCGLPIILARRMTYVFRQADGETEKQTSWVSEKKAHSLTIKELLERYNPNDPDSHVTARLMKLSKKQKCIVFDSDGKVDVDISSKLLQDISDGFPALNIAKGKNGPVQTYFVGERPDSYWDENPLYSGRALRSGQLCDQTNRSWEGIPTETRRLLYLALNKTGEIQVKSVSDAHDILDKLMADHSFKKWSDRCPVASILYQDMEKINSLPVLRIKSGKKNAQNNPFGTNVEM